MSEYTEIALRKIIRIEGLERSFAFTASAFCGPHSFVIFADPAEILSLTKDVPGYKREHIGERLTRYRSEQMLAQDTQCPIVMPSIGLPFHNTESSTLYDAPLVRTMVEKGVQSMPFCLLGADPAESALLTSCISATTPVPLEEYRPSVQPEDLSNYSPDDYTIAFEMDEMINAIDAHFNQHMGKHSISKNDAFYSAFPQCRDMLDILIASGCRHVDVERYWDGESILSGMKVAMEQHYRRLGADNPSAIELIDRFALLHERKLSKDHAAKESYLGIIEGPSEFRLHQLAQGLAGKISVNDEAVGLASTELSDDAQSYLRSLPTILRPGVQKSGPDYQQK